MAEWESRQHLEDHFVLHGHEVGAATIEAYDASARVTLGRADIIFGYTDRTTGLRRVGNYHAATGLFTATNTDDEIVSHFRTTDADVQRLIGRTRR